MAIEFCQQRFKTQPMTTQGSKATENLIRPNRSTQERRSVLMSPSQALERLIAQTQRWRLSLPLLLFLDAHRPLRFLAGQTLVAAAPMASLLGFDELNAWAAVLDDEEALLQLRQTLETAIQQDDRPT